MNPPPRKKTVKPPVFLRLLRFFAAKQLRLSGLPCGCRSLPLELRNRTADRSDFTAGKPVSFIAWAADSSGLFQLSVFADPRHLRRQLRKSGETSRKTNFVSRIQKLFFKNQLTLFRYAIKIRASMSLGTTVKVIANLASPISRRQSRVANLAKR